MKVTDYKEIRAMANNLMSAYEFTLPTLVGVEIAEIIVANVYMTNDLTKGFGQDIKGVISIITSEKRCSVIMDDAMSFWQDSISMCGYEDLETDVHNILNYIQAAIDRIEYNRE